MRSIMLWLLVGSAYADSCSPAKDDEEWCHQTNKSYVDSCNDMCVLAEQACERLVANGGLDGCYGSTTGTGEATSCENTEYLQPVGRCPNSCDGQCWAKIEGVQCPPGMGDSYN